MANMLPRDRQLAVLAGLVDGNAERAVERITSVTRPTINLFARIAGEGAARLHDRIVRELSCSLVSFDEQWAWCGRKPHRVDESDPDYDTGIGAAWVFCATDLSSRMIISFHVGKRDQENTDLFIADLRARLIVMPQLMTSDGSTPYESAVGVSFGRASTYAQTVKHYRSGAKRGPDHRYEPPRQPFMTKRAVFGAPDLDKASTSYVERNNLTMRHINGRLRRLCLAFSKKLENHRAAVALAYTHYNFCRVVRTLRVTPAIQAGVTDHVWSLEELLAAIMTAPETEKPAAVPLRHLVPETTARELPGARGFLRVVQGGKGAAPSPAPAPLPPAPPPAPAMPAPTPAPMPSAAPSPAPTPPKAKPGKPVQLSLFGDPPDGKQT
jgi:IS1 family transposase